MIPRILLVPVDFSATSEYALDYACVLAARLDAKIQLVHALGANVPELDNVFTDSMIETLREGAKVRLEKLAAPRRSIAAIMDPMVLSGEPRDAILDAAVSADADMIVIGSHGRRGMARVMLGSVAEQVARRANCPVLIVHGAPPN